MVLRQSARPARYWPRSPPIFSASPHIPSMAVGQVHLAQIRFDRLAIDGLAANASGFAHPRGRRRGVGSGQRLVGEPRVRNEASRSRRTHHVSAPKRVNAENGIGNKSSYLVHYACLLSFDRTEPHIQA